VAIGSSQWLILKVSLRFNICVLVLIIVCPRSLCHNCSNGVISRTGDICCIIERHTRQ